jgi:hypothetical protein
MDNIDNLIYTALNDTGFDPNNQPVRGRRAIIDDLLSTASLQAELGAGATKPVWPSITYPDPIRTNFVHLKYPDAIESAYEKHWYDISDAPPAPPNVAVGQSPHYFFNDTSQIFTRLDEKPLYHLMYAYLIENTRIAQIFERLISMYHAGEDIGITNNSEDAFRWMINTEYLFFKPSNSYSMKNITSLLRPDFEASRRNAYYRLFGMDLAFGRPNDPNTTGYNFVKPKASNSQFIPMFEQFLSEIWQAYINALNTSGVNTTDVNNLVDLADKLKELLDARRGDSRNYTTQNLSREEYSSCFMMTWYHFVVSYDSPLVQFLKCEGPTPDDRLGKIGLKVGIPAHSKCKALFDLAGPTADVLKILEDRTSVFHDSTQFSSLIQSKGTNSPYAPFLDDIVLMINNWEKATGHRIKNPEANIRGTVSIAQPRPTNGKQVAAVTP